MKKLFIIFLILIAVSPFLLKPKESTEAREIAPLWEYECIDTMKTSRDNARRWANSPNLKDHINNQMDTIVEMGGNCVAIATPYDNEFLPYLKEWVNVARDRNLHIWYRGNFSSWEGWFGYPSGMSISEHNARTREFILGNQFLFEDGDIFTPSPEAENGGPFNQVEIDEHEVFREYLIEEYTVAKEAFEEIGKDVRVNWLAMNGGLAQRMFDQTTLDEIGGVATLDHYIKTPGEMGEFIRYFHDEFGAKVVIGEWGAPIPQINGDMTEDEQAAFIRDLLWEMYIHNEMVVGINYWVLYDGSTSLQNPDYSNRKAIEVMKGYLTPGSLSGYVKDSYGDPLGNAEIVINGVKKHYSDKNGYYEFSIPSGEFRLGVSHPNAEKTGTNIRILSGEIQNRDIILVSTDTRVEHWFRGFISGVVRFLRL